MTRKSDSPGCPLLPLASVDPELLALRNKLEAAFATFQEKRKIEMTVYNDVAAWEAQNPQPEFADHEEAGDFPRVYADWHASYVEKLVACQNGPTKEASAIAYNAVTTVCRAIASHPATNMESVLFKADLALDYDDPDHVIADAVLYDLIELRPGSGAA